MAYRPYLNFSVKATIKLTDNTLFGIGTKCPSSRDVHRIESQIMGVKKGRDQLYVSVLQSAKRESTVSSFSIRLHFCLRPCRHESGHLEIAYTFTCSTRADSCVPNSCEASMQLKACRVAWVVRTAYVPG